VFKEKILIPLLRELSSQATLDELLLMRSETLLKSDESIQAYRKEKIKAASLRELTSIASKHQDNWLIDLIESDLKVKIPTGNLRDLLQTKSEYKSINEPKVEILELFDNFIIQQFKEQVETMSIEKTVLLMRREDGLLIDLIEPHLEEKISTSSLKDLLGAANLIDKYNLIDEPKSKILKLLNDSITQQVKAASFDDLLAQRRYWDILPDEIIELILKNNVSAIIDNFANSISFDSAGSNSRLLVKIAEYLTTTQWENILEAFFQNNQIYSSYRCYGEFKSLFKKSYELSNSVQPYWLNFREKLNQFDDEDSNSLKRLIDEYV
jgi:hypothetical protein